MNTVKPVYMIFYSGMDEEKPNWKVYSLAYEPEKNHASIIGFRLPISLFLLNFNYGNENTIPYLIGSSSGKESGEK